jgi:hypothetical protein
MRRAAILLLLLLGMIAAPLPGRTQDVPAPAPRTEEQLRTLYTGQWNLAVSHTAGQAAIDRGIERAVTEMNYFLQSIARTQMHDNTPVNDRIDIAFPDGQITVVFDQRFTYTTRPGVSQDFPLPDGSTVAVRQYFRDGHLEQYFETGIGRRWSVYELSADGRTMTTHATQQGPMMPVPMAFTLDYHQ